MRSMPAEWEHHRGTVVAWPSRPEVWGAVRPMAEREYAALIAAIAEDEPVTVVCRAADADSVRALCRARAVSLLIHPIDDGWIRDNGPAIVREPAPDGRGRLTAVVFGFNSWGDRFGPTAGDLSVRKALIDKLGLPYEDATAELVLEGGAISSNGAGTLLVSAECVLTRSRNPDVRRDELEKILARRLGAQQIIWIPHGLLEDLPNTDGHVDNVAVFVGPREVLVQTVDADNPNAQRLSANRDALHRSVLPDGTRLRVIECAVLPYVDLPSGDRQAMPYVNFALTNRSVILPSAGQPGEDARAEQLFRTVFPERRIKFTPAVALTYGGGGPHCITLNVVC